MSRPSVGKTENFYTTLLEFKNAIIKNSFPISISSVMNFCCTLGKMCLLSDDILMHPHSVLPLVV